MLMLAVLKKLVWHHNNVVAGKWRTGDFAATRTYEVEGKRLGIVGLGNIGKKVARRVQGFDMDVRYFDILRLTEDQEDALGVRFTLFTELLRTCDVVTLHVPLNDVTRKMMSTREFAMMKRTAILINTCRGPVVDETALHQALTSGTIAAAGLHVMVEEPPAPITLFSLPNVTISPLAGRAEAELRVELVRVGRVQHPAHGGRAGAALGRPRAQVRMRTIEAASKSPIVTLKILSRRRLRSRRWTVAPNASHTSPLGNATRKNNPPR
jgi:phosphoglycerate dehydrogenase-like enzyme